MPDRLTRDPKNSMLGGVCAGFAKRYGIDVTLVRIVLVLLTVVTSGIGAIVYIAAWIVMPREDPSAPPRAVSDGPSSLGNDVREVSDRLVEAARVLAEKTREAAEEIAEIARRAPASSNATSNANTESVSAAVDARSAEAAPPPTMEEDEDLANGRESDEGLPPLTPPATPSAGSSPPPSSLPRAMSEQAPTPPPTSPAGAPWPPAPVPPPAAPTPPVPPVPPAP